MHADLYAAPCLSHPCPDPNPKALTLPRPLPLPLPLPLTLTPNPNPNPHPHPPQIEQQGTDLQGYPLRSVPNTGTIDGQVTRPYPYP